MAVYQLTANDGSLLDARFQVEGDSIVFHSRGGSKGVNATNPDYSPALRLLIERLAAAGNPVQRVWVDSAPVQAIPISQRTILEPHEADAPASKLVSLMATRMQAIGRKPTSKSAHGNATKKIRLQLPAGAGSGPLLGVLKAVPVQAGKIEDRLPTSDLDKVTAEHLWHGVQLLQGGFKDHEFGESTDYDVLLADGLRLPPKAVFGLAASEALGFKVKPSHFAGGLGTPCFRVLGAAGYQIVPKNSSELPAQPLASEADSEWREGNPKLRKHLRRERAAGLSAAKKAAFRRLHGGKLFCEKCGLEPIVSYGDDGDACIEVHHSKVLVSRMEKGHVTKLEDLECLCANCHRVEHRKLRNAAAAAASPAIT